MSFILFKGLTAYFSKKTLSFISIKEIYGGEVTFVPAYKKPDIWFGTDRKLLRKKNTLHERWIYDSILLRRRLPFDDYYIINQLRLTKPELFHSNKLLGKEKFIKTSNYAVGTSSKNLKTDSPHTYLFTPIQSTSVNYTTFPEKSIDPLSSISTEKIVCSSSDKNHDLLFSPYQKIEDFNFDKSLSYNSLSSFTKDTSSINSSIDASGSPIERIKVLSLEDLESAVDIFEVIAVEKMHNKDGILFLKLK
ncbi:hypothetical protein PMAC_002695 [Pneumocystis sp. 'macacae']|nr:hypothetical protein PMAC_002695 [Pneumocystis sp. 'macacae']